MMWIDDPLVAVRPLTPDRYEAVRALESRARQGGLWRFPTGMPDGDEYVSTLWANVLGQCVLTRRDGSLAGMVMVYDVDLRNGVAWVAVAADGERNSGTAALLGLGQVITELFREWPLRRVCAEVLEPNLARFEGVHRYATELGRLRDDRPVGGRLVDLVILGIDRDVWQREAEERLLRRRPGRHEDTAMTVRSGAATPAADVAAEQRSWRPRSWRRLVAHRVAGSYGRKA